MKKSPCSCRVSKKVSAHAATCCLTTRPQRPAACQLAESTPARCPGVIPSSPSSPSKRSQTLVQLQCQADARLSETRAAAAQPVPVAGKTLHWTAPAYIVDPLPSHIPTPLASHQGHDSCNDLPPCARANVELGKTAMARYSSAGEGDDKEPQV